MNRLYTYSEIKRKGACEDGLNWLGEHCFAGRDFTSDKLINALLRDYMRGYCDWFVKNV